MTNTPPPPGPYTPPSGVSSTQDDTYTILYVTGRQLTTLASIVKLNCVPPACPPVLSWTYSFDYNGTHYAKTFSHTYIAGDTVLSILNDFAAQFTADPIIQDVQGDAINYAIVRAPVQEFEFFQRFPFVNTSGPGAGNPIMTAGPGTVVSSGGKNLEIAPFIAFTRSTLADGVAPKAGDLIGGMYWVGDTLTVPADAKNVDPLLAQMIVQYGDPATGQTFMNFTMGGPTGTQGWVKFRNAPYSVQMSGWIAGSTGAPMIYQDGSRTYIRAPAGGDVVIQDAAGNNLAVWR